MRTDAYIFDMCMLLHPLFKDTSKTLDKVVRLVNHQHGATGEATERNVQRVRDIVRNKVRYLMMPAMTAAPSSAQRTP